VAREQQRKDERAAELQALADKRTDRIAAFGVALQDLVDRHNMELSAIQTRLDMELKKIHDARVKIEAEAQAQTAELIKQFGLAADAGDKLFDGLKNHALDLGKIYDLLIEKQRQLAGAPSPVGGPPAPGGPGSVGGGQPPGGGFIPNPLGPSSRGGIPSGTPPAPPSNGKPAPPRPPLFGPNLPLPAGFGEEPPAVAGGVTYSPSITVINQISGQIDGSTTEQFEKIAKRVLDEDKREFQRVLNRRKIF